MPFLRSTPRRRRSPLRLVVRGVLALGLGSVSVALTLALVWEVGAHSDRTMSAAAAEPILLGPLATRSIIYDRNGKEMDYLYAEQDREEVSLDRVPVEVQTAILTIEDEDFRHHMGVSLRSIGRAFSEDVSAGGVEQGGSTITQQLIKNDITGDQQTWYRKIREAVLAVRLEKQMSKDQILERYLNSVYLGHGAYGVEAGAETYFDKTVDQLEWPEAALLAALIRNPTGYDPVSPDSRPRSKTRREVVVKRLLDEGKIDKATAARINAAPLPTKVFKRAEKASEGQLAGGGYFSETVKQFLLDLPALGATATERYDAVFGGGLRVYTTYDPDAQHDAEQAVTKVPDSGGKFFAGLVSLDNGRSDGDGESHAGAVRAMVGGPDFEKSQVNYVTQGWRQPGSSFKFFVLMAAMEAGYVPSDTISGASPCRFPDPTAKDGVYQAEGGGKTTTITGQTEVSSNCGFLRLGQTVGLDRVADLANRMGMRTIERTTDADGRSVTTEVPIPSDILSLPLGSKEVHPIDMAAAYATAANDGEYNPPYFVDRITDAKGKVLYRHEAHPTRVVSVQTARLVTEILRNNVTGGTGRKAALKNQVAAGKTGTTQDNADAWFVGFTPYATTAVWLGSPAGQERIVIKGKEIFGADYPAVVWNAYNAAYHEKLPPLAFEKPLPTRKGKAIKYRNKVDSGGDSKSTKRRRSTTTTVPGGSPPPDGGPSATSPPATSPPGGGGGGGGGGGDAGDGN